MTTPENMPTQAVSIFEQIKKFFQDFDLKQWAQDVGGASGQAIEAAFYFEWIKNNLLLFSSASIGFLLGYKLG